MSKQDETTHALVTSVQNELDTLNEEISDAKRVNYIAGEYLPDFMFTRFLDRIDPIEYCQNILRDHLPESKKYLHSNQVELIRAACNPNIKQVSGIMARQCIAKGTMILDRYGNITKIEDYQDAWLTRRQANTLKLVLQNGNTIQCTGNHPIMTQRGWVKAEMLLQTDKIYCLHSWDKFLEQQIFTDEQAELLGLLLDADIFNNIIDAYFMNNDLTDRTIILIKKLLPEVVVSRKNNNLSILLNDNYKDNLLLNHLVKFLRLSTPLRCPYFINMFTKQQLRILFKILWDIGGYNNILLFNESISFIKFIKLLLNKFGIEATLDNYYVNYNLKLIGHNFDLFKELIDLDQEFIIRKFLDDTIGEDGERLYLVPITTLTNSYNIDVYDASFPEKLWFIADSIKVHNSGKCLAPGTPVRMADGHNKVVEEINIGDKIMGIDGMPRWVSSTGYGIEEMYTIVPKHKGYYSYTVNSSHILSLKDNNNKIVNTYISDFLKLSQEERNKYKGYRLPIELSEQKIPDNIDLMNDIVHSQSIPNIRLSDYILYNSLRIRRQFLARLIDTFAQIFDDKYLLVVPILVVNDYIQLFQSSGFNIYSYTGILDNIIESQINDNNITMVIEGDFSELPLIIKPQIITNNFNNTYDFDIKELGQGEYYGFSLSDNNNLNDKLFFLGDYTVTHNTESIASMSGFLLDNYPQMRIGIFTPRLQQAEVTLGRLSTFFQMNEERLNNKIEALNKDKIKLSNNSIISAVSASDQSNIEGLTFDVIILDEAQKISDYTWSERIAPMGGGTNAKIIKIGTPKTRNHFYDCVEGAAATNWKVVRKDWTQCEQLWALDAIMLPDKDTGIVRPYSRYVVEKMMPKALKQWYFPNSPDIWSEGGMSIEDFKTQYMLEFVDGAGKFLTNDQLKQLSNGDFEWLDHGQIGERYVAGIDFAGSNPEGDFTHITVMRINPDGTKHKVFSKEFEDTPYPAQMYEINKLFGGYKPVFNVYKIAADMTGCGAPIIQSLQQEYGLTQLEGIIFNSADRYTRSGMNMKNVMYSKFVQALDNDKVKYPAKERFISSHAENAGKDHVGFYHKMLGEWSDLEMETRGTINKRIEAPKGEHDDVCSADVLALWASENRQRAMPRGVGAQIWRR